MTSGINRLHTPLDTVASLATKRHNIEPTPSTDGTQTLLSIIVLYIMRIDGDSWSDTENRMY